MITFLDASSERFLLSLEGTKQRLDRAQRQLSSGKRINSVADEPDSVSALLRNRADLDMTTRIKTDMGRVKNEVDSAESAMSTAAGLVEHARVLTAQGATGTATPQARTEIAAELGDVLQQLVAITNTSVEGRYVFSGDSDQTTAYSIDLTQAVPVSVYQGTAATRQVLQPNGSLFSIAKNAQQIFDSAGAGENVFGAINAARLAMQNNDPAGIAAAAADIATADTYLNTQHAFYGGVQSQINSSIDQADKAEVRLKAQIGNLEDADMAQAALDLNDASIQQNAALQSRARLPRTSLFDFLA